MRSLVDEVPFDIPDSWEWVRLGNISSYAETKQKVNATSADPTIWGLDLEDIEKGGRLLEHKTVGERKAVGDKTVFAKGDILYSKLRPYLLKILVAPDDGICTPEIVPFRVYGGIDPNYIVNYLKSPYVDNLINSITYGVKMPRVGTETMTSLLVPVPPLEEQRRIVEKIDEVASAVSAYDVAYQKTETLNSAFPEALKKSILQEAVQGKLVPQDPSDEPAEALLERIRAEKQRLIKEGKIKKDKHESIIFRRDNSHYEKRGSEEVCIDDEIPFEIPDSWMWARLKSLGYTQTGNTPSTSHPEYRGGYIPFITPGDIAGGIIDYENQGLSEVGKDVARVCPAGSILQVCIGGSIGKAALSVYEVAFNQQINAISPVVVSGKYVLAAVTSFMFLSAMKESAGGTATPILNRTLWDKMLIPLPPLNEQNRIVSTIEQLFSVVATL